MQGVELLVREHQNILRFIAYWQDICCKILEGAEVDCALFRDCIDFARNYADKHHHGKEEEILFDIMVKKLGGVANKLITNGMLVEHDLGRLHLSELSKALEQYEREPSTQLKLDILVQAMSYGNLLKRHIAKEDETVYTFAERLLSQEDKQTVDAMTAELEESETGRARREKYLAWLDERTRVGV